MNTGSSKNSITLVTGGTGLIGSHLLYALLKDGKVVRATKRKTSDIDQVRKVFHYYDEEADSLFLKIEWINANLLDPLSLNRAFENVNVVYHCAGMVSFFHKHRDLMHRINVEGTGLIVDACLEHKVAKLCYLSSSSALGKGVEGSDRFINEQTPWDQSGYVSHYGMSKYEAEGRVWKGIEKGLYAVIVNPVIVVGPGEWSRSSARIFETVWNGLAFYGPGVNSFVDVRDVVKAIKLLARSDIVAERYILASENLTYKTFLASVAKHLGKPAPRIRMPGFISEIAWRGSQFISRISGTPPTLSKAAIRSAYSENRFSNEKIRKDLDFHFISVEESIRHTSRLFLKEH